MDVRPGAIGRGRIFRGKALQFLKKPRDFIDPVLIEEQPRPLQNSGGTQTSPTTRVALVLGQLQQRVGLLHIHPVYSNPRHDGVGAQYAVQQRTGVDERHAVDQQGFCLVQPTLLVSNAGDQARG